MNKLVKTSLLMLFSFSMVLAGIGDPAPDFTLNKQGGGTISLNELKGKIIYIFWFGYN